MTTTVTEAPQSQVTPAAEANLPVGAAFVRVVASGFIEANNVDTHLLFRLDDGGATFYQSFAIMQGSSSEPNPIFRDDGLELGRNGWHNNAYFSIDYTLTLNGRACGTGRATFINVGDMDKSILGYDLSGAHLTNGAPKRISLSISDSRAKLKDVKLHVEPGK